LTDRPPLIFTENQEQSIGEVSKAISQIDGSTQNNASIIEELTSTLDNLNTIATVLAGDVQKFRTAHDQ